MSLTEHEALKRAWKRARTDFPWFCKKFVRIKDKDGRIEPFVLNQAQLLIYGEIKKQADAGEPIRIIIVKGRQQGCSTLLQAYLAWRVMLNRGMHALTIAHDLEPASQLFGKIELLYDYFPDCPLKPELAAGKRRGRKMEFAAPIHGMLYVETSQNQDAGRSGTFQLVHASEIPYWSDAERTMNGLLDSVPPGPNTAIVVESTAGGVGDYFHTLWEQSVAGKSGFKAVFVPWFLTDEYTRERNEIDDPLDARELALQKKYKLTDGQLLWYRDKLAVKKGRIEHLYNEYPSSPADAFWSSGLPFFFPDDLKWYRREMIRPPIRKGEFRVVGRRAKLCDDPGGRWWLWKLPKPGARYCAFADTASGRAKDRTAIHVMDVDQVEVVATFRGNITPDACAQELNRIGLVYNSALVACETNNHGEVTIHNLSKIWNYPNLYRPSNPTGVEESEDGVFGWRTTRQSKLYMLNKLQEVVNHRTLKLYCARTLEEMETMVVSIKDETARSRGSEKIEASGSKFDDMVMSLAGCNAIRRRTPGRLTFSVAS